MRISDWSSDVCSSDLALLFHSQGRPGKIQIISSKPMSTQRDLSLAYSPGVAVPVREIARDPDLPYDSTSKGNLVAVISNGRSEERRVGTECDSTCRPRWAPSHQKKKRHAQDKM